MLSLLMLPASQGILLPVVAWSLLSLLVARAIRMILLPVVATSACLLCINIAKLWEMAGKPYDANTTGVHDVIQGRRI